MSGPGDAIPGPDDLLNPGLPRAADLAAAGTSSGSGGDDAYGAGGVQIARRPSTGGSPYPGPGTGGSGVSGTAAGGEGGSGGAASLVGPPRLPSGRPDGVARPAPEIYKLRTAPDRLGAAQRHGASPETEAAVKAALKWLADNQKSDGRWSARETGAGQEWLRRRPQPPRRRHRRRHRHHRSGAAVVARLGQHAPRRRVPRERPPRPGVPAAESGQRRQPGRLGQRLRAHVLPRHRHLRHERGLRHDGRPAAGATGPARHRLHGRLARPDHRRLALRAGRSGRHEPARLATDGPEERRTGRHPHAREDQARGHARTCRAWRRVSTAAWPRIAPASRPRAR